jgi:diguanylate cyclase (GGDEF)-like protein/PAS domain S-box-containing protein
VLREAAVGFAGALSGEAVATVAQRAVSRLSPDGDVSGVRFVAWGSFDQLPGVPAVSPAADMVAVPSVLPTTGMPMGTLLVGRAVAEHADLSAALGVISAQAALALERVRLNTELTRYGQDHLNAMVEQTADVILIVDDDDRIRYASPSARVLLGTSALRDTMLLDLVDPAQRRSAEYLLRYARRADPDTAGGSGRADWIMHTLDGRTVQVEVSCRDLRAEDSVGGIVVTLRDVTAQRHLEHELTRRVFRDTLTGLPNRLLFGERLSEAMAAATGVTGVLLINLDNFRVINEGLGRETGDAVMRAVATRLRDTAGADYVTARLGGDEFAVLIPNAAGIQAVEVMAARITDALNSPILGAADVLSCTGSVGVATSTEADTEEELLRHADLALDAAKAAGNGRWRRYDSSMINAVMYRMEMRLALGQALHDQSLIVEYQPIVALATGRTAGFEALVRWRHPTRGLLSPSEFIDIAEESGLITPIGEWVLATAICSARQWPRFAPEDPPYVSVNVSPQQFRSSGFVDTVRRLLIETGLPPDRLVLEITESLVLRDDDGVWEDLRRLRRWGIRVAIDDFGTGYSALSYLRRVPLDIVKLDRIFISTMTTSSRQRELVEGIVRLTRALDLAVVAEGIETEGQRDMSTSIGCTYGQGYLYSRSMPETDAADWLAREQIAAIAGRHR